MMNDLAPNNSGKVTKGQFVSGLTTKGLANANANATKIYDSIDSKKAGSITKSKIEMGN
jgi:Ca2+-binding EF-hand superfamily protein